MRSSQTRDRGDRHRHLAAHAGETQRRADADELRDADADVRDQHRAGGEQRPAHAVLLADQLCQALAGHGAHPRGHLLHHDQRDRDHDHHPQQVVAVLGADGRVGGDAAGVVAGVCSDQAGAEECERGDEPRGAAPSPAGGAAARCRRPRGGALRWLRILGRPSACTMLRTASMDPSLTDREGDWFHGGVSAGRARTSAWVRTRGVFVLVARALPAAQARPRFAPTSATLSWNRSPTLSPPKTSNRRRQPRGITSSSTSSTVTTPIICRCSSTTGATVRS